MKKVKLLIHVITGILIFAFTSCLSAQEFPQWRGINRDGIIAGFKPPQKWPQELKQQWKVNVGFSDASPVLAGNKLYIFSRVDSSEILRCLDSRSGKELWQNKYPAIAVTGAAAALHPGPRSTPAVAEGKIITLGVGNVISCLDASTGKVLWRKENLSKVVPQFFTGMSPVIADGICFAHLGGRGAGEIVAFDLSGGNEKWKWTGEGPSYSSPVIINLEGIKQIVFVTEKNIIGFNLADGKILWQVEYLPQNRYYNAATPVFDGQTLIITGQGLGTKAIKIQKEGNNFVTSEIWNNADAGTKYCTPVLKDGFLYGISDKRKIYCLNAVKGQTAWIDTTMHTDFGAFLNCGSVILAIPGKSELIALNPDNKKYSELARIRLSDTPIYAHPLIVGNLIYIKDKEDLILYSME